MSQKIQESWNKMYNEHTFTGDSKSCVHNYESFAKEYDEVSANLGFTMPQHVADLLKNEIPRAIFDDKNSSLLDVAAGTGLIGDGIRKHGFNGFMDGLDGSLEMMVKAKEKGEYRKLMQHILLPGTKMPLSDKSYDIVTCVAALSTGHIESVMLRDMLRVVKTGGHFIFTVRDNITAKQYVQQLKELIKKMEDDGEWTQVSVGRVEQYAVNCATSDDPTGKEDHPDNGPMYSLVYHYVKK